MSIFDSFRRRPGDDKTRPDDRQPVAIPAERALDLDECLQSLEQGRSEIERLRRLLAETEASTGAAAIDMLGERIANPIAHLVTQRHLAEGSSGITTQDLSNSIDSLITALASAGLSVTPMPGTAVEFDPNRHLPEQGSDPRPGRQVEVRTPGLTGPGGRVLRRAGVVS